MSDVHEPAAALRGVWPDGLVAALNPILDLLADERVTEIEANGHDEIWIKGTAWRGHRRAQDVRWSDRADFEIACIRISDVIGRSLSKRAPLLNARLPGGERVNIAIAPACDRIAMTIRKFPAETMTFDVLERNKTVCRPLRTLCEALVKARRSILVAGGTGAGKTSLLNALSRLIPSHERVVTIEDARELQIQQPNWVAMETVEPYEQGATPVTIGDLVRNALRQAPDRIIVGEVRGEEAFYLLRALSTGHGGGFGTIHANDGDDALHQLQLLAQMAPIAGLSSQVVASMVARAVDIVIYLRQFGENNVRRVSEVLELRKPGVRIGSNGEIEYLTDRLALWNSDERTWTFPKEPPVRLSEELTPSEGPGPLAGEEFAEPTDIEPHVGGH
jgi:pilus assembly protein CpaF